MTWSLLCFVLKDFGGKFQKYFIICITALFASVGENGMAVSAPFLLPHHHSPLICLYPTWWLLKPSLTWLSERVSPPFCVTLSALYWEIGQLSASSWLLSRQSPANSMALASAHIMGLSVLGLPWATWNFPVEFHLCLIWDTVMNDSMWEQLQASQYCRTDTMYKDGASTDCEYIRYHCQNRWAFQVELVCPNVSDSRSCRNSFKLGKIEPEKSLEWYHWKTTLIPKDTLSGQLWMIRNIFVN